MARHRPVADNLGATSSGWLARSIIASSVTLSDMRSIRSALCLTLAYVALLACRALAQAPSRAPFAADIAAFRAQDRANPPKSGQILFLGSSSFTRWSKVQQAFPTHPLLNRAFGGSTLLDLARYLDDIVDPYKPKEVVLYCGENDLAADPKLEPNEVAGRFETLFLAIRAKTHEAPFVYVSMKPSPSRWNLAEKFRRANAAIKGFLENQAQTTFIDVWPVMLGQHGLPKPSIYVEDRLHMNDQGYALWIPLIEPALK